MQHLARYGAILATGLLIGLGLTLERAVLAERQAKPEPLPLAELRNFAEIFGKIKSEYVEPVDDRKLIEDAIQGMLSGLDPHSAYLNPEAYKEIRIGTEGEFGGLGIEVTMEDGFVKIVAPIDDTPAAKAGLRAGDLIVRIDDTPVKGLTLSEAVKKMRGKPGTRITLSIVRQGVENPFEVTLTRAVIKIRSVKSRMLDKGYGYLRITQFQANTADHMQRAVKKLRKAAGGHLLGLVLDLRNNPGGVLNAAVAVSDAFLEKGKIVYTQGRAADSQMSFNATPGDILDGAPMVVLVNEGSASASEIVAGALQDHRRAVVMGTKTFGKGSVQSIVPVNNNAALKLTTARYYTPKGRSIQATGIVPDVVVEPLKLAQESDAKPHSVREADLAKHLRNDKENDNGEQAPNADETAGLLREDYQLREALNLLKGVNIVGRRAGGA